jgi:hypothetical protein
MEKREQLFSPGRVLLVVVTNSRACSSYSSGFTYPQQKNSPPKCKASRISGAFSPFGLFWFDESSRSGETDLAVEREGSSTVDSQHDSQGGESEDVVIDSEALMDADVNEGYQHIDGDQSCGKSG